MKAFKEKFEEKKFKNYSKKKNKMKRKFDKSSQMKIQV